MNVNLTFFCELETEALRALFDQPSTIEDLSELGANVSLGLLDLSPQRAEVARRLQAAGVPTIAWLLLPKEEGYWFNRNNAPQAVARYADFKTWSAQHGLEWQGVGVDIEMDLRDMEGLIGGSRNILVSMIKRMMDLRGLLRAQEIYTDLVEQMHIDGYRVDGYHFPLIVDERKAGARLIRRVMGLVECPTDREVLMLYSSMFRPHGSGILWSYAPQAESVAVGITGGGVQISGMPLSSPLNWEEFSRDLRLAHHWTKDIHIFSLEGCVEQGFLERMKAFKWDRPVSPPLDAARAVDRVRKGLYLLLWASTRPFFVLAVFLGLLWLISSRWRKRS